MLKKTTHKFPEIGSIVLTKNGTGIITKIKNNWYILCNYDNKTYSLNKYEIIQYDQLINYDIYKEKIYHINKTRKIKLTPLIIREICIILSYFEQKFGHDDFEMLEEFLENNEKYEEYEELYYKIKFRRNNKFNVMGYIITRLMNYIHRRKNVVEFNYYFKYTMLYDIVKTPHLILR
jgi:hypothetical protein